MEVFIREDLPFRQTYTYRYNNNNNTQYKDLKQFSSMLIIILEDAY